MAIFKCKMCGGELNITEGVTVAECEYCGTQQTLPKLDDDRRANLYDRANHFRRGNDFDKAMGIYEKILMEDNTDAEAYWSLVLCRYGIEYVEDPATHKRVPTVNRAQYTSIFDDDNYKSALQYADSLQRGIYEDEARTINEIQKGILAISQQEEPFDVFICYKETDNNGRRTPDSVLANDLYHQLTQEGFKVFFSRITLEDKLGSAYEPYIFAALNSAKVMVVLGTRPEYFNAVWVKNEWSRYLALIKQGAKKMLIPAYRDMDPYDLPEEFSHLQAQDMSKLGFMQDLIRGIKKIARADEPQPTVVKETVMKEAVTTGSGSNIQALLDRGSMALEDGEWSKADGFFEDVLNNDARNARAYLGKALAQERCGTLEEFIEKRKKIHENVRGETLRLNQPDTKRIDAALTKFHLPRYIDERDIRALYQFDLSYHSNVAERRQQYQNEEKYWTDHKQLSRAEKFATGTLADELAQKKAELFAVLNERIKQAEKNEAAAIKALQSRYDQHLNNADVKAEALYQAGIEQKESYYQTLVKIAKTSAHPDELESTARELDALGTYKDSKALYEYCLKRATEEREKRTKKAARNKKIGIIIGIVVAVAFVVALVVQQVIIPNSRYNDAVALKDAGRYEEAIAALQALDGYKDSEEKITALWNEIADRDTLVSGTYHIVGLKADGTVVATGNNDRGQCNVLSWTDIVALAAGEDHTVGLKSNGTVIATGSNNAGQCDVGDWTDIVAIAAGKNHTVGLKMDGTVVVAGYNSDGQCNVSDWTDIIAIAANDRHTIGLKFDGTVVAVGRNSHGQCDVSDWTNIVKIATGTYHTIGLKEDGTVVAAGHNNYGQCNVSDWTDIVDIAAHGYRTVALNRNGTVVAIGNKNNGQCDVSDWTDVVAVAAGVNYTVGLKSNGTAIAVGANTKGQRDVSDWTDIKSP